MNKQILIAIDDSPTSSLSLEYAASLFGNRDDVYIKLCHCVTGRSSPIPPPEDERNSLLPQKPMSKSQIAAGKCLNKGVEKLASCGLEKARISTDTIQGANVATALLTYSEKHLFDALLVSRRGVGLMGELLLGSVSSSLFDKSRTIPLWILDGAVTSTRMLVPVDGTPHSMMAIDHLAHIFKDRSDIEFFLFHTRSFLSSAPVCKPENFYDKWGKEWCDANLSGNGCLYTGPASLLTDAGIPERCIRSLPVPTTMEESTAIISCARKHKCGTIVIGRRPESGSKGFLGGVTRRTIKQTENMALWIIG
ncbi:universal stress protein [Desulfopila sp. IMCC35008]|uniref:universal stress protein n=1 Tax=Desulfopila sp. IMCC35008 TaxID=2653858 RepID=UPI0013D35926|nr:universal stress protein [Desulfopila sp. IMCC35008]